MLRFEETGGHGGDLQAAAELFGFKPEDFCDFSSNVNPLGPPPGLVEELRKHLHLDLCQYPVPQARIFRKELAEFLDVEEKRLLLGNGASELIYLFFLWARPKRVLLPAPTFSEYERAARLAGAQVKRFSLLPGKAIFSSRLKELLPWGDCLVLCNPNNPTGVYYERETVAGVLGEALKRGIMVFLDESFFFFTGRPWEKAFFHREAQNLWSVVSLTKIWALPGLRLGFLAGPPEEIRLLTEKGDPWRVNALAQRAGIYCLGCRDYLENTWKLVQEERAFLVKELKEIDALQVFPSESNFLLIRGEGQGFSSADLWRFLAARGLLIRNAANFPGLDQRYFRLAVLQREKNRRLVRELKNYFHNNFGERRGEYWNQG